MVPQTFIGTAAVIAAAIITVIARIVMMCA